MARFIAALTLSGASKLTSPWSRRNGSLTLYIMSRMRMMPENGMVSRNWPMVRSYQLPTPQLPTPQLPTPQHPTPKEHPTLNSQNPNTKGSWKRETGNGKRETGNRQRATGNGQPATTRLHQREDALQRGGGAVDGQVADVEVPHAGRGQLADRPGAHRIRRGALRKLLRQRRDRHGQELAQRLERLRVRRSIVEDAEHPGQSKPPALCFGEEALHGGTAVMRHDLCQVELGGRAIVEEVRHLRRGVAVRVGPAAERDLSVARADHLAQLPRVLDAARRPDVLVAAEDHERLEAVMARAVRVGQAELCRVLAGQEGDHVRARHVAA